MGVSRFNSNYELILCRDDLYGRLQGLIVILKSKSRRAYSTSLQLIINVGYNKSRRACSTSLQLKINVGYNKIETRV